MPDLSIDYRVLSDLSTMAKQAITLFDDLMDGGTTFFSDGNNSMETGHLGLDIALVSFERTWAGSLSKAKDKTRELGDLADQLAKAWFDADAAAASQMLAGIARNRAALDAMVQRMTPEQLAKLPPEMTRTGPHEQTLPGGATQQAVQNPDGSVTITMVGPNGMTYTQSVKADENGDLHTTIKHPDGSSHKIDIVTDADGSRTQTVTSSDGKEEKKEVSVTPGPGVLAPEGWTRLMRLASGGS